MIDDIVQIYEKQRKNLGRPFLNPREDSKNVGGIISQADRKSGYLTKNPKSITLSNIPDYSEHGVKIKQN